MRTTATPSDKPRKAAPLSANDRKDLARRQTAELYRLMPASTAFSYVGAILAFLMLVSTGDANRGVYWFAFASTVMLFRALVICEYRNHTNGRGNNPEVWKWLAIVMNLLAGIQWGLLGTLLFAAEPIHRALFTAIMIVGYVGGAVISYAPVRFAHTALAVPAVLPSALYLFLLGDEVNVIGGVASLFMLTAVIVVSEVQYRIVRSRLLLEIESDARLRAAHAENTTLGDNLRRLEHRAEVIKRSQIEARRRADTLSHHMQHTLLPVIECDGAGRIVEWNSAATAAFGYQFADLTNSSLDQLLATPADGRGWKDLFASSLEGKVAAAVDVLVTAKDGKEISAKFFITPIDIDGTKSRRAAIIAIVDSQDHNGRRTFQPRLKSVRRA